MESLAQDHLTAFTQLYKYFKNEDRTGGMHIINYYALDNLVTHNHVYACEGDAVSQETGEGQKPLHTDR